MKLTKDKYMQIYKTMQKIRRFELEAENLFKSGNITGLIHLYLGQEAIATGVCANLKKDDYITSNHRGHGHCIAKGADPNFMMAELLGKKTGYCKGKGGSMHIADFGIGIVGANGIVGGGLPIAVGVALYSKLINKDNKITVCFFGDGASNTGLFHESLNFAAIKKLPVLFVCENNKYAVSVPASYSIPIKYISDRSKSYNMEGLSINGCDVLEVYNTADKLISKIRQGGGPILLECKTYRWHGHYVGDPQLYKDKKEQNYYINNKDPIKLYRNFLFKNDISTTEELDKINIEIDNIINEAVIFAKNSPFPDKEDLFTDLFM